MLSIQLILIFMIVVAIVAVELKDMISSVIALGALGLGISLSFLLLQAPDLAVILLIVEIVTLTLLTKATIETSRVNPKGIDWIIVGTVLVFIVFILTLAYLAIKEIPLFGYPLMRLANLYISEAIPTMNSMNIVTSIAVGFRGYDILGAILVLFAVTIGVKLIIGSARREE